MAAATFDDQLHVFAIGNDTAMWTRAFDGDSWTGEWASLGGSFASQPSVVVWANGSRITVFGLDSGAFDTVSKERRDGEWSDTWRSMNGSGSAAISSCHVVADYDRADIFTRSIYARANIVHDWWHVPLGDWWGQHLPWDPTIGGTSKSAPAAVCRNSTIFHDLVIYDEASGSVMHDQWDNKTEKWIGWENRGGSFVGNPVLVSPSESRVDFFGIGTDGGMYHFSWDEESSYSELEALGGNFSSIPSVIVTTSQRLDVVAVGTDDKLKHRALINSTWILDWEDMGVFANSAPLGIACGNETSRRVGVFILDQNSEAQYASWLADDSPSWNGLAKFGSIGGNLTTKWQWEPY
ncbi:hypothetical protein GGR57DRAFT_92125 [Xylariaceae sp. FL1272]|nr:hypothetical protein GGR57DRAFT_92125 [Xylariaceae sp. FL1272]